MRVNCLRASENSTIHFQNSFWSKAQQRIVILIKQIWGAIQAILSWLFGWVYHSHPKNAISQQMSFDHLPTESIYQIFQYLENPSDRKNVALTCKRFRDIINDQGNRKIRNEFKGIIFKPLFEGNFAKSITHAHEIDIKPDDQGVFNVDELFTQVTYPFCVTKNYSHLFVLTNLTLKSVERADAKHIQPVIQCFSREMKWDLYFREFDWELLDKCDRKFKQKDLEARRYSPHRFLPGFDLHSKNIKSLFSNGKSLKHFFYLNPYPILSFRCYLKFTIAKRPSSNQTEKDKEIVAKSNRRDNWDELRTQAKYDVYRFFLRENALLNQ